MGLIPVAFEDSAFPDGRSVRYLGALRRLSPARLRLFDDLRVEPPQSDHIWPLSQCMSVEDAAKAILRAAIRNTHFRPRPDTTAWLM